MSAPTELPPHETAQKANSSATDARADVDGIATEGQSKSAKSEPKSLMDDEAFYLFILAKIALIRSEADHTDLFVQFSTGGLTALYRLGSARFHEHLNQLADEYTNGDPQAFINKREFAEIQEFLRAKSHRLAKTRLVSKRVAWLPEDQAIWIDLSHDDGQCIRVTAAEWAKEEPIQPIFVRHPTQRPLPTPEASDDGYSAFKRVLPPGISAEHEKLLLGALLACLVPPTFAESFSYPIIILTGEAGSGKSTLAKLCKAIADPEVTAIAARPSKIDDLYVAAQTSHLLSYDNVDFIKGNLSDAICQLTTGSAVVKRRLYTDSDLAILRAKCAVMLNGISPDIPRQDLLDRSVSIHLSRIEQYSADAANRFDADLPLVMGYLCELLSRALANYATTTLTDAPRLTLAAKIATAAEPFGCDTPFVELLRQNQHEALLSTQDNDLVIASLFSLLAKQASWTGTYKKLLDTLTSKADDATTQAPEWPTSPHKLARHLREHSRLLREQGIEVTNGQKTERGRIVTIKRLATFITSDAEIPF